MDGTLYRKRLFLRTKDIETEEDLTDYAGALLVSSDEVSSISVSDDVVSLTYDQPVKLFGLFSVAMKHRVDVASDPDKVGRVKVRFPWWSFLAKKDISADEIKTAVENELELNKETEEGVRGGLDQEEVLRLQTLGGTMKTLHDTAMAIIRKIGE